MTPERRLELREYHKRWRDRNKAKILEHRRRSSAKADKQRRREWQRAWRAANPHRIKVYNKKAAGYLKTRRAVDPEFKLRSRIGNQMRQVLRRIGSAKEGRSWQILVGYTPADLKIHLESQFEWWMDWDNHGLLWEIDHIQPVSSFNLPGQIMECWALSNLRPLQKEINRDKLDRQ